MSLSPIATQVAIVGGGPAGLMAAELLSQAGLTVDLFDAKPSVGRKFLLAGRGGLNLTHSEPLERFIARFAQRADVLAPMLHSFGPEALRAWAEGLGIATFVGSSGRVFPTDMKAAPMLRAWLHRLRQQGVRHIVRPLSGVLGRPAHRAGHGTVRGLREPSAAPPLRLGRWGVAPAPPGHDRLPPFWASLAITCLCNQMFIEAESCMSPS